MTLNSSYTAKVLDILEDGSAILELPQELCDTMGWKVDTKIDISLDENGYIVLKEFK